jgi:cytidine deaminase
MQKLELTHDDTELVAAAMAAVKQPILQIDGVRDHALVAAALRLDSGEIMTAQNLIADVGSISMCAEPQAIAQANRHPDKKITTIVAVYHQRGHAPRVIPPCGRCREVITDFTSGHVILRDPGTEKLYKVLAIDLLPFKYADYWKDGALY